MQESKFTCLKCHKDYPIQSKVMHEIHCTGVSNESQPKISEKQPNMNVQNQAQKPIEKPNQKCPKCGIEFPINEMADHLLVHQLDEENNVPEGDPQDQFDQEPLNELNQNYDNNEEMNNNQYEYQMSNNSQPQVQSVQRTQHMTTDQNGYSTEVIEEVSGNMKKVTIIKRAPNGNIVSQSTESVVNNSTSMNFNGMPMSTGLHFGSGPLNLSSIGFDGVLSSFMNHPFFNSMINNQNNLEDFVDNLNQPPQHPVSEQIINELPEITIDSVDKLDGDKKECIICLNSFKQGDKALILPCIHLFHKDCIKNWFTTQNTCPICKFKMDANSLNNQNAH